MPSVRLIRLVVASAVALSLPLAGGVVNAVAGVAAETPKPEVMYKAPIRLTGHRIKVQRS